MIKFKENFLSLKDFYIHEKEDTEIGRQIREAYEKGGIYDSLCDEFQEGYILSKKIQEHYSYVTNPGIVFRLHAFSCHLAKHHASTGGQEIGYFINDYYTSIVEQGQRSPLNYSLYNLGLSPFTSYAEGQTLISMIHASCRQELLTHLYSIIGRHIADLGEKLKISGHERYRPQYFAAFKKFSRDIDPCLNRIFRCMDAMPDVLPAPDVLFALNVEEKKIGAYIQKSSGLLDFLNPELFSAALEAYRSIVANYVQQELMKHKGLSVDELNDIKNRVELLGFPTDHGWNTQKQASAAVIPWDGSSFSLHQFYCHEKNNTQYTKQIRNYDNEHGIYNFIRLSSLKDYQEKYGSHAGNDQKFPPLRNQFSHPTAREEIASFIQDLCDTAIKHKDRQLLKYIVQDCHLSLMRPYVEQGSLLFMVYKTRDSSMLKGLYEIWKQHISDIKAEFRIIPHDVYRYTFEHQFCRWYASIEQNIEAMFDPHFRLSDVEFLEKQNAFFRSLGRYIQKNLVEQYYFSTTKLCTVMEKMCLLGYTPEDNACLKIVASYHMSWDSNDTYMEPPRDIQMIFFARQALISAFLQAGAPIDSGTMLRVGADCLHKKELSAILLQFVDRETFDAVNKRDAVQQPSAAFFKTPVSEDEGDDTEDSEDSNFSMEVCW